MARKRERHRSGRRVQLPSGRIVEVAPSAPTADAPEGLPRSPPPATPIAPARAEAPHVCPACDSALVYAVAWRAADPER